jgi:hypothetical protein
VSEELVSLGVVTEAHQRRINGSLLIQIHTPRPSAVATCDLWIHQVILALRGDTGADAVEGLGGVLTHCVEWFAERELSI